MISTLPVAFPVFPLYVKETLKSFYPPNSPRPLQTMINLAAVAVTFLMRYVSIHSTVCLWYGYHTRTQTYTHTLLSFPEQWMESLLQPVCCLPGWLYAFGRRPVLCHQQTHCNCTLAINTGWASESAGWEVIFTEMGKGNETIEAMAKIFFEFPIWNICFITCRHTFSPLCSNHSPPTHPRARVH